jgi:hypothetical protein
LTISRGNHVESTFNGRKVKSVVVPQLSISCERVVVGQGFSNERAISGSTSVHFYSRQTLDESPVTTRFNRVGLLLSVLGLTFVIRRLIPRSEGY